MHTAVLVHRAIKSITSKQSGPGEVNLGDMFSSTITFDTDLSQLSCHQCKVGFGDAVDLTPKAWLVCDIMLNVRSVCEGSRGHADW